MLEAGLTAYAHGANQIALHADQMRRPPFRADRTDVFFHYVMNRLDALVFEGDDTNGNPEDSI